MQTAPIDAMGTGDMTAAIAAALQRAFGGGRGGVKKIMAAANCNERAAKNWLAGRNAPDALYLLRLLANVPELAAEVRRLTAMHADLDPEFARDLSTFLTRHGHYIVGGRP